MPQYKKNARFATFMKAMIKVTRKKNEQLDQLTKRYRRKLDEAGIAKEQKRKAFFEKKSTYLRMQQQRAIKTQRYKVAYGLV